MLVSFLKKGHHLNMGTGVYSGKLQGEMRTTVATFSHIEYDDVGWKQSKWGNRSQRASGTAQSKEPTVPIAMLFYRCLAEAISALFTYERTFWKWETEGMGPN